MKHEIAEKTLDKIRNRFGYDSIKKGILLSNQNQSNSNIKFEDSKIDFDNHFI